MHRDYSKYYENTKKIIEIFFIRKLEYSLYKSNILRMKS
jgi:hypothetical protein